MKSIRNIIIIILTMIFSCFVLSVISNIIPSNKIRNNIKESIDTIIKDDSKQPFCNFLFFKLDNFTDALMLNIAYNINYKAPLKSSMENKYYIGKNDEILFTTDNILNNDYTNATPINYTRYWHGNQLFLRPLLLFFNYVNIRILNYICLVVLFIYLCILLLKINEKEILYSICISAIAFNLWIVPLSMQFSTTFFISLLTSVLLLTLMKNKKYDFKNIITLFIIVGGATSFFDLLTTPLITLGLPLIIYTTLLNKNIKERLIIIFSCSASWLLGYSCVWISKWCIAHLIIGYDINDAISSIIFRTSTEYDNFDMSFYGIIEFLIHNVPIAFSILIILFSLFIICNIIIYYKNKKAFIDNCYLLLIATMPFIWCIVLRNHSIIHCSFVWRIFFISMVSYCLFLFKYIYSKKH